MKSYNFLFYLSLLLILLASCEEHKTSQSPTLSVLSFDEATPLDIKDFVEEQQYILLSIEEEALFRRVDKLLAVNDHYYLFDHVNNSGVLVFDAQGNFVRKVGTFGEGPNELQSIEDFQVNENGEILVLDATQNKIFVYSPTGEWEEGIPIPVNAGGFVTTENGWLFAIDKDNQNDTIKDFPKIGSFDTNMKIDSLFYTYPSGAENANGYYHAGLLSQSSKLISYNRPPDDTISIFSNKGKLIQQLVINFKDSKLPIEVVNNIFLLKEIEEKQLDYRYIQSPIKIVQNHAFGLILGTKNDFWSFSIDLNSKKLYTYKIDFTTLHFPTILFPSAVTPADELVTLIEPISFTADTQPEKYPAEVIDHFKNEGSVLLIHTLKAN